MNTNIRTLSLSVGAMMVVALGVLVLSKQAGTDTSFPLPHQLLAQARSDGSFSRNLITGRSGFPISPETLVVFHCPDDGLVHEGLNFDQTLKDSDVVVYRFTNSELPNAITAGSAGLNMNGDTYLSPPVRGDNSPPSAFRMLERNTWYYIYSGQPLYVDCLHRTIRPSTDPICPRVSCVAAADNCLYAGGKDTDDDGCIDACGQQQCVERSQVGKVIEGGNGGDECPWLDCIAPPQNCRYVGYGDTDGDGCPDTCGELECTEDGGGECPLLDCAAPPQNCRYVGGYGDTDGDGCPDTCGELECTEDGGGETADASCQWKDPDFQAFSHDGSFMVFSEFREHAKRDIYLYNTTARTTRALTDKSGNNALPRVGSSRHVNISGDGNTVVFVGSFAETGQYPRVLRMDLNNNTTTEISNYGIRAPTSISSDGRYVLMNNNGCLYLYDSQADSTIIIVGSTSWSPSCISGAKNPVSGQPLDTRFFPGRTHHFITSDGRAVYYAGIDCDPTILDRCVYTQKDPELLTYSLYRYDVGSGSPPVRVGEFDGKEMQFSGDGNTVYYTQRRSKTRDEKRINIFKQDTGLQTPAQMLTLPGASRDNGRHLYSTTHNGHLISYLGTESRANPTLYVYGEGGNTIEIGNYTTTRTFKAPLSPDGRFISYTDRVGPDIYKHGVSEILLSDLFVRDIQQGGATHLVPRPGNTCDTQS